MTRYMILQRYHMIKKYKISNIITKYQIIYTIDIFFNLTFNMNTTIKFYVFIVLHDNDMNTINLNTNLQFLYSFTCMSSIFLKSNRLANQTMN